MADQTPDVIPRQVELSRAAVMYVIMHREGDIEACTQVG
jgi:hypothetical protein